MTLRLVGRREAASPTAHHRRRGRPKWLLIGLVVAMFCSVLLLNGLVRSQIGIDARGAGNDGDDSAVPASVSEGGPVLDTTGAGPRSYHVARRTIALTFDDGPDPGWTPGSWRCCGSTRSRPRSSCWAPRSPAIPGLIRQFAAEGDDSAYTPSPTRLAENLAGLAAPGADAQTQTGASPARRAATSLLRPPYSVRRRRDRRQPVRLIQRARPAGLPHGRSSDLDSRDWERPGVDAIVRNATPRDGRGGVVLMHDAGGDRSQTVAALDRLIPEMQQQGYRFTTVERGRQAADRANTGGTGDHRRSEQAGRPVASRPRR